MVFYVLHKLRVFILSVEQSDFEWFSWYWAGQLHDETTSQEASSGEGAICFQLYIHTEWVDDRDHKEFTQCRPQRPDIPLVLWPKVYYLIVGKSESQLKCRRHVWRKPSCTYCHMDNACMVNQDRSSDAHLEMNVRLFTSCN